MFFFFFTVYSTPGTYSNSENWGLVRDLYNTKNVSAVFCFCFLAGAEWLYSEGWSLI